MSGSEIAVWPLTVIALLAVSGVLYHARNVRRLLDWLRQPIGAPIPDARGRWGDAFAALRRRSRQTAEQREQLRQALIRFQAAAEALPDGVAILAEHLTIEWLNHRAEDLLALDNRRDAGSPMTNLVRHPEFVAYLTGANFSRPRTFHSLREPSRQLQIQAIPFGEGRTMVLIRDVTQMERLETMRRDFVANVSHELKTPLTVVGGFIDTLADSWEQLQPQEIHHFLELAGEQAARMQRLIEDLLTLSTLETDALPQDEPVAMAAVIADLTDEANALSAGRHRIQAINRGPVALLGNPDEIRSALTNLVSNAIRYTPQGGAITLEWFVGDDGGGYFSVIDTGIGIESSHISRLTERFYRVDRGRSRDTGGTGLGLAIVKHVMERHGGRLLIDSEPGRGSRFTAAFPMRRITAI